MAARRCGDGARRGPGHGANHAHLSFSHGERGCPYAARGLAEAMAVTAVEVLLDRLPHAVPDFQADRERLYQAGPVTRVELPG